MTKQLHLRLAWPGYFVYMGNPLWAFQAWDEKDATAVEEEFSLEDLFGDDEPAKVEL